MTCEQKRLISASASVYISVNPGKLKWQVKNLSDHSAPKRRLIECLLNADDLC